MSNAIYKNLEALGPAMKVVAEAAAAISDGARNISTSSIPEVLGAVVGGGAGVGIGVGMVSAAGVTGLSAVGITSGLAMLGTVVGGGMLAGVFVAGAPMAVLGVAGYGLLAWRKHRKLVEAKEALFTEALLKRDAILRELDHKVTLAAERVDYLTALNIMLREVIANLAHDLGRQAPQDGGSPPCPTPATGV